MELTEFERAILDRIWKEQPEIRTPLEDLPVVAREYTPCGCYTDFETDNPERPQTRHVGIDLIEVPGVENGMCAILILREWQPLSLELVTFGGEAWDGGFEGFEIRGAG